MKLQPSLFTLILCLSLFTLNCDGKKKKQKIINGITKIDLSSKGVTEFYQVERVVNREDLHKVTSLWLKRNNIQEIDQTFLNELTSLKYLDVSSNNISRLNKDESTLSSNSLKKLIINRNPLNTIKSQSLIISNSLKKFSCKYCKISTIDSMTFKETPKLKSLSLKGNENIEITSNAFLENNNLKKIDLSETFYFSKTNQVFHSKSVTIFICARCKLMTIDENTFKNIENVRLISIKRNPIKQFNMNVLQRNLPYLKYVASDAKNNLKKMNNNKTDIVTDSDIR